MTLKSEIILERLAFLKSTVEELKKLRALPKTSFKEKKDQWAVEHGLHVAAEAVFDIGNHILVGHFSERVSNYQEIIRVLSQKKVISDRLAGNFDRLGGFRNLLVHDYSKVDFDRIHANLKDGLGDFEQFMKEIAGWLKSLGTK